MKMSLMHNKRISRIKDDIYLLDVTLMVIFQMLSLKNGLSLHPMCYPEGLQPLSLSRLSMELSDGNRSTPLNMTSTLPHPQDNNPLLYASNLPNKNTLASQPSMSSYPSYVNNNVETSFAVESRIPSHKRPLQQTSEVSHLFGLVIIFSSILKV